MLAKFCLSGISGIIFCSGNSCFPQGIICPFAASAKDFSPSCFLTVVMVEGTIVTLSKIHPLGCMFPTSPPLRCPLKWCNRASRPAVLHSQESMCWQLFQQPAENINRSLKLLNCFCLGILPFTCCCRLYSCAMYLQ